MRRDAAAFAILVGGGIAGALDITYAILISAYHGVSATRLLQSVASGLLGAAAYEGGRPTAALGLGLHFFIALTWASIFYLASRRLPILTRQAVSSGVLYGIFIYGMMNLVVLPLSAYPGTVTFTPIALARGLAVHMFCIGLPMALAVRHVTSREVTGPLMKAAVRA